MFFLVLPFLAGYLAIAIKLMADASNNNKKGGEIEMIEEKYFSKGNLPEPSTSFENNIGELLAKLCLEKLTNHSASNVHLGHNLTFNRFVNCTFNIYINSKDNE